MKLVKLNKETNGGDNNIEDDGFLHLPASINALTLCGIGEEDFDNYEEIEGKLDCPRCLEIVSVVRGYLRK
jgi:hypothetical protein